MEPTGSLAQGSEMRIPSPSPSPPPTAPAPGPTTERRIVRTLPLKLPAVLLLLLWSIVPLAMTLQSVTEHLMKENRGRAPTQQSRSRVRLRDRSFTKGIEVGGHLFGFCGQFLFVW